MTGSAAFWFSIVTVGYWAFWNFHRPHHPDTIRFSVTRRRYLLGVTLYITAAFLVFLFALLVARLLVQGSPPRMPAELRTGLPLAAALAVTALLPRLPGTRYLTDQIRRLTQAAALYPQAVEHHAFLLAKGGSQPNEDTRAALRKELAIFALQPEALDRAFPPGALGPLEQAYALQGKLMTALQNPRLRAFVRARSTALDEAKLELQRLLRRVARATLLADALRDAPRPSYAEDDELPGVEALAQFIREESNAVASRFHRIAAECALSMFSDRDERDAFLSALGYVPPPPLDLPFASIVAVAAVAPATALLFLLRPLLQTLGVITQDPAGRPAGAHPMSLSVAFAVLQLIIVLWAVVPKALTRWAWPRYERLPSGAMGRVVQAGGALPLGSYVLAATGAFLTQAAFGILLVQGGLLRKMSPFGIASLEVMLITGAFAIVSTVGLCLLIDRRILDVSYRFAERRWLDGLLLATAMMAADACLVQPLIVWRGGTPPGLVPTLMMGGLGFVLGWLVPAAVAAWLNHRVAELDKRSGVALAITSGPDHVTTGVVAQASKQPASAA